MDRSSYLIVRHIADMDAFLVAAVGSLYMGQTIDREIRSIAFQSPSEVPDMVLLWDLVLVATDYEKEALLASGTLNGIFPSNPEVVYPRTGTPGFQRSLRIDFRETSTGQAALLLDLAVTIEFERIPNPAEMQFQEGPGAREATQVAGAQDRVVQGKVEAIERG